MLKGEKVELRPVRRVDIDHYLKWFNDPEVTQYLGTYLPMTEMYEENMIENLGTTRRETDVMLLMQAIDTEPEKPVGTIGLHRINWKDHHATFGISIGDKDYWSRGYGTEAARLMVKYGFEQLNLHRINSTIFSFNERSLRMHSRVGFVQETVQREHIYRNGKYHDCVLLGLLKKEWLTVTK